MSRVNKKAVEMMLNKVQYTFEHTASRITTCRAWLPNGFLLASGESICNNAADFNREFGEFRSRRNCVKAAKHAIYMLESYLMLTTGADSLYWNEQVIINDDTATKAPEELTQTELPIYTVCDYVAAGKIVAIDSAALANKADMVDVQLNTGATVPMRLNQLIGLDRSVHGDYLIIYKNGTKKIITEDKFIKNYTQLNNIK